MGPGAYDFTITALPEVGSNCVDEGNAGCDNNAETCLNNCSSPDCAQFCFDSADACYALVSEKCGC